MTFFDQLFTSVLFLAAFTLLLGVLGVITDHIDRKETDK